MINLSLSGSSGFTATINNGNFILNANLDSSGSFKIIYNYNNGFNFENILISFPTYTNNIESTTPDMFLTDINGKRERISGRSSFGIVSFGTRFVSNELLINQIVSMEINVARISFGNDEINGGSYRMLPIVSHVGTLENTCGY